MDSNLAIVLAAFIGAVSGFSGTFMVHIATKKKDKKKLLRDKAEELHGIIQNLHNIVFDEDFTKSKSAIECVNELKLNQAIMIVDFYFPELEEVFNELRREYSNHLRAKKEDKEQTRDKVLGTISKLRNNLIKNFVQCGLNK